MKKCFQNKIINSLNKHICSILTEENIVRNSKNVLSEVTISTKIAVVHKL